MKISKQVGKIYAVWFNGVPVNIWKLSEIKDDIEAAIASGDPESKRVEIVAKYAEKPY